MLKLKGRALDCMARMALAVGKAEFAPYVDASIQVRHPPLSSLFVRSFIRSFFKHGL